MSDLESQIEFEKLFAKNQLKTRIWEEFSNQFDWETYSKSVGLFFPFTKELLIQMVLHKRTNLVTLVGILRKYFDTSQECVNAIELALVNELIYYDGNVFLVKFDITQDVQEDLNRYQFPLPMIVEPKKVNSNQECGYYSFKYSVLMGNTFHEEDVCLDVINILNSTKLRINQDVSSFIKNSWRKLAKPKVGESHKDFKARHKAFDKYNKTSLEVIFYLGVMDNEFWLTHGVDFRGRIYSKGYHVNYQGNDWNKAVIEFAEGEIID